MGQCSIYYVDWQKRRKADHHYNDDPFMRYRYLRGEIGPPGKKVIGPLDRPAPTAKETFVDWCNQPKQEEDMF